MLALTEEQKRRRWLALGIVALAYVLSFFQRFAPAGIAPDGRRLDRPWCRLTYDFQLNPAAEAAHRAA